MDRHTWTDAAHAGGMVPSDACTMLHAAPRLLRSVAARHKTWLVRQALRYSAAAIEQLARDVCPDAPLQARPQ
jgi:hypothetical protein